MTSIRTLILLAFLGFTIGMYGQLSFLSTNNKAFAPKYFLMKGESVYINDQKFRLPAPLSFTVEETKGDSIFISLPEKDTSLKKKTEFSEMLRESKGNSLDEFILLNEKKSISLKFKDWDTNVLTIPIKIRPKIDQAPLQFIGDVSLGSYLGYQTGRVNITDDGQKSYSQTFAIFAAPGAVQIDPSVAQTDQSNISLGFSFGVGYLVNLNNFQIAFVTGFDYISGDVSSSWIYQGKQWYSFTIGFDFNDEEKS